MFGALCLGIQRQVATDLSWFAARAWTDSTPSHCLKFRWSLARACWRDCARHDIDPHRFSHCHYCVTVVRTFRTSSRGEGSSRELSILHATRLHLGVDRSLSEPLGSVEPRFVRDLGGVASRANSRILGYDGLCHRPARASSIFRNAAAVQHQTDVLLSLAACSRMSLASQFRGIGLSRYGSRCLVMASDVRDLRDGRRHRLCIQSPHYVCTPGPRYRSTTSSRTRVITLRQSESFQMLGSRSKYSSSSFFPPSPAPNCFSDWINSMRSIHLTIL